jgi:methylated-DNA-protein-cysteine methyltransferase-like protein
MTPFARIVLDAVDRIPRGSVMSYSDVAEYVGAGSGRAVGRVMATHGGEVAWHRVVRNDGSFATHKADQQLEMLRSEGVPVRGGRVDMARARWDGQRKKESASGRRKGRDL